jgi:hypothetical protein
MAMERRGDDRPTRRTVEEAPGEDSVAASQSGIAGPYDPWRRAGKSGRHIVRLRDGAGMMTQIDRPQATDRRAVWRRVHDPRDGRGLPWE